MKRHSSPSDAERAIQYLRYVTICQCINREKEGHSERWSSLQFHTVIKNVFSVTLKSTVHGLSQFGQEKTCEEKGIELKQKTGQPEHRQSLTEY